MDKCAVWNVCLELRRTHQVGRECLIFYLYLSSYLSLPSCREQVKEKKSRQELVQRTRNCKIIKCRLNRTGLNVPCNLNNVTRAPILWPPDVNQRANLLEKTLMLRKIEGKKRREQQRMRWLSSISNTMHSGHESEQTLGDSEAQGNLVCYSPWSLEESDITQ